MRTVALEEHFSVPSIASRIDKAVLARRGYRPRTLPKDAPNPLELLPEIGERRLKSMDDAGITVQVLSNSGPGPDLVPGADGVAMARETNDQLAKAIARHPDRFAGFAALPLQSPDAAARRTGARRQGAGLRRRHGPRHHRRPLPRSSKLRSACSPRRKSSTCRSISIRTFRPSRCGRLISPTCPTGAGRVLETAGWGWHSETAVHVLRMVVAGTLDRHPRLKLIIGHMGEMLPMMLARADEVFALDVDHLKRPISRTILDQVWITTSGIFDEPPFLAALLTFGIDRIMFSVDYPYAPDALGRKFLERISLSPADMEKLTHGNADALLKLKVR